MTKDNWLALFVLSALGISGWLYAKRPKPRDDGWIDIADRDWWDL